MLGRHDAGKSLGLEEKGADVTGKMMTPKSISALLRTNSKT